MIHTSIFTKPGSNFWYMGGLATELNERRILPILDGKRLLPGTKGCVMFRDKCYLKKKY